MYDAIVVGRQKCSRSVPTGAGQVLSGIAALPRELSELIF
jgi:hypothetical protein